MQVVRKGSRSEYSLRFIHAIDNGTRINRSMAIRSIGLAARYALRRSTVTQSVNIICRTRTPVAHSFNLILSHFASFQCERLANIGCGRDKATVYAALDSLVCFSRMCRRRGRGEEIGRTTSVPVFNSNHFGRVFTLSNRNCSPY